MNKKGNKCLNTRHPDKGVLETTMQILMFKIWSIFINQSTWLNCGKFVNSLSDKAGLLIAQSIF